MRFVDVPPVWTAAMLAVTWGVPVTAPFTSPMIGWLLLVQAAMLFIGAAWAFAKARTTIVPRQTPSALVTTGVFGLTRNPIYLADLLILAGLSFLWARPLGLGLVPVLGWILTRRFILGEEARLRDTFGQDYDAYAGRVRRWI